MTLSNIQETKKNAEYYRKKIELKQKNPEELRKLFDELNKNLEEMAKSSGMSVDELIEVLDPSNPFPF